MSVELKPTGEKCEKCTEGYLVERVNSLTKNSFIGCSTWPDCAFTKRGGENPTPPRVKTECFDVYDYDNDCPDNMCFGDFDYCDGPGSSGWY